MAVDTKQEGLLIRLPENRLPKGFNPDQEVLSLAYSGGDLLVLRRRARQEKAGQVVRLWGDLERFAIPDILLLVFWNHLTGVLSFELADGEKKVFVKNGELVFAQSSLSDERLGECLVRMGKITQAQLDDAAVQITQDVKLGKILVESGLISPKELFDGVRQQTLDIIYSLFSYSEGKFHVAECGLGDNVELNLETRDVIRDGMLLRWGIDGRTLTRDDVFPRLNRGTAHVDLNSEERNVCSLVAEGRSLDEIVTFSAEGELHTLQMVYHLERQGVLTLEVRRGHVEPMARTGRLERVVSDFNSIFMDIYSILVAKVQGVDVKTRLNSFFDDMPADIAEVFDQVRFLDDGSLPIDDVLGNLRYIERDDKTALAVKAFNELLYFTLFEMRNYLSREDAERLMEIVQNMELF